MSGISIETVKTNSFSMNYLRFGKGDKTLVILPGISVQNIMVSADAIAEAFRSFGEDYTVYLFDRKNELPASYSVHDMALDTTEAFRSLGLENICLYGASQGGMIAMDIAADNPGLVHKLAVASTSSCVTDEQFLFFTKCIELANSGDREKLYLSFGKCVYPEEVFEQYREFMTEAAKSATNEELERFIIISEAMKNFDIRDKLDRITCPVLVVASKDDQVFGEDAVETISEHLKDNEAFELYIYDGYGNAVYDTAPDFKERMMRFLAS